MKGATTEPFKETIKVPINRIVIIKGASQYFLRTFKKSQISFDNSKNSLVTIL